NLSNCTLSFLFNDTPPSKIYTLSLHDALPIYPERPLRPAGGRHRRAPARRSRPARVAARRARAIARQVQDGHPRTSILNLPRDRSEEHTSELQSRGHLVCRLLLEKKNK